MLSSGCMSLSIRLHMALFVAHFVFLNIFASCVLNLQLICHSFVFIYLEVWIFCLFICLHVLVSLLRLLKYLVSVYTPVCHSVHLFVIIGEKSIKNSIQLEIFCWEESKN